MRRTVAVAVVLVATLLGIAVPAAAGGAWEPDRVHTFDAQYEIRPDGVVVATETIAFAHRGTSLIRQFRLRGPDDVVKSKDRVFEVSRVSVTTAAGTVVASGQRKYDPMQNVDDTSYDSRYELLDVTVGAPDDQRGVTYVLRYELRGALDQAPDGLRIRLPGLAAEARADAISATVKAPGGVKSIRCDLGGLPCRQAQVSNGVGHLGNSGATETLRRSFRSDSDISITVGVDSGAVSGVGPVLKRPSPFVGMSDVNRGLLTIALLILAVLVVVGTSITMVIVVLIHHRRRSRALRRQSPLGPPRR